MIILDSKINQLMFFFGRKIRLLFGIVLLDLQIPCASALRVSCYKAIAVVAQTLCKGL